MAREVPCGQMHQFALQLAHDHPEASGVGIAFTERDGKVYAYASAVVIRDDRDRPLNAARMIEASRTHPERLGRFLEIAAVRSVQVAHQELDRALDRL